MQLQWIINLLPVILLTILITFCRSNVVHFSNNKPSYHHYKALINNHMIPGKILSQDCPQSIDYCSKDMRTILNDTRFTFAQNDQQLDILCLHLNRTITCINKFIECDPKSNLKKDTFNGLLLLMDKLCSKTSKFRIEYLRHAECYHKLAPVYKKCYQLYYASEKQRIELNRNITTDQHLALWCCNYKNHRKCTTDPVRRSCGSAAANLAEQIVIISEGQDTLNHCPKHIISSSDCLKQWDSLGLLINSSYGSIANKSPNIFSEDALDPDRVSSESASGSSSSLLADSSITSSSSLLLRLTSILVALLLCCDFVSFSSCLSLSSFYSASSSSSSSQLLLVLSSSSSSSAPLSQRPSVGISKSSIVT